MATASNTTNLPEPAASRHRPYSVTGEEKRRWRRERREARARLIKAAKAYRAATRALIDGGR